MDQHDRRLASRRFHAFDIAGVALVLVYAVLAALLQPKAQLDRRPLPTKAELGLLTILRALLPRYHVNCQVSMGALLKSWAGLSRKAYSLSRNKVSQKVVDFVVMDPALIEVYEAKVWAIEASGVVKTIMADRHISREKLDPMFG